MISGNIKQSLSIRSTTKLLFANFYIYTLHYNKYGTIALKYEVLNVKKQ